MRILVVEDEHKIAHSIKQGLEQEKYVVDVAYNGNDGLDLAISEEYDAIILDRMLPTVDGLTIVRALRKDTIHTPVLLLTAKGQINERVEGLNAGADDYLTKPFAFAELVARIRALTRRPRQTLGATLSVADIRLDPIAFTVTRGDTEIKLSNKEFMLLEYLMRHAGKVVTKEQIINHVWDYDANVLPNSVEVYIKHLRQKLDFGFMTKRIHTVRGFGYKIER